MMRILVTMGLIVGGTLVLSPTATAEVTCQNVFNPITAAPMAGVCSGYENEYLHTHYVQEACVYSVGTGRAPGSVCAGAYVDNDQRDGYYFNECVFAGNADLVCTYEESHGSDHYSAVCVLGNRPGVGRCVTY